MPVDEKDVKKDDVTPADVILEENKKIRAELEELKKQVAEYKAFAAALTRRKIDDTSKSEEKSGDRLDEIVANYKKGYER